MISEFKQIFDCPGCETDFEKGDIVYCMVDPLYLMDSHLDYEKHSKEIGIVTDVVFYKDLHRTGMPVVICELAVYWARTDITSYHLDKYLQKIA